ncbi:MAG: SpoIIE family protein phosphatase [Desulfamplus sp.]|nr:SpoIIE family protein phosphatase [Desulfamplus sp.]
MTKDIKNNFASEDILDSIVDGVYVTDFDRKIIYWNKAAEKITGWRKEDVLGLSCMDEILSHVDKESRKLCGKDTCPLYRSIVTGQPTTTPIIVYAQKSNGDRVPVQVNVSPLKNSSGEIIGGVEVFRDVSDVISDLDRAKRIQNKALKWNIREDSILKAAVHYIPHDIIGGDYYAVDQLSKHQYVFLLADVMGHGTSAALHTMYLRSLWEEHFYMLPDITKFIKTLNQQLYQLMHGNFSFAAAVCGVIDTDQQTVTLAGGAFPEVLIFNKNDSVKNIQISGFALGMVENADYPAQITKFGPEDVLFVYTDGAIENPDRYGEVLGEKRFKDILQKAGYPQSHFMHQQIEEKIIELTANAALKDDVTFLEFHWPV